MIRRYSNYMVCTCMYVYIGGMDMVFSFRVDSMPYYALVLEGSFEASESLRRGQWCQSEELDDLETLGQRCRLTGYT